MAGVPAHAAGNETVELVRRAGPSRAVPFANAVMRRLADGIHDLLVALGDATAAEAALKHSYPDWIAETFWREHGRENALGLLETQNEPPPTVVRVARSGELGSGEPDPE